MPQTAVDYAEEVAAVLDRTALVSEVHTAVVTLANAAPEACKTWLRPIPFTRIGHEDTGCALVHVDIALLAGRTDETKAALAEAVVEAVRRHVRPPELPLRASVEIRDLDASYRRFDT